MKDLIKLPILNYL